VLRVTEEKNLALVSLDRPEVRNAFDLNLIRKITDTFHNLSKRTDLRAVVLSGEGKAFCAGADLNWMKSMVQYDLAQNQKDSTQLFEMFEAIWNCPFPVIGVVHGAAFGGALGLIAACDYVIAEEKTQMCFSEVKIGIVPAVISVFLAQKLQLSSISHLMMTGKMFSPQDVKHLGLVHEIVAEAHLAQALGQAIKLFQEAGPEAVRATKRLVRTVGQLSWSEAKMNTCQVISQRRISGEGQEGLKSFLEKRDPQWKVSHGL
jgi:methylglutaconyl-CoA hydratase